MTLSEYEPLFQKYFHEHYEEFNSSLKEIKSMYPSLDKESEFNSFLSAHVLQFINENNITVIDADFLKTIMIITEIFYDEIR